MEIKLDLETIKIPPAILKQIKDDYKSEILSSEDIIDWASETSFALDREIVKQDLAIFLVEMCINEINYLGGYPIENWIHFTDGNKSYSICTYGWTSECEDNKGKLRMIGYKKNMGGKS
jgi:hypothetical protein